MKIVSESTICEKTVKQYTLELNNGDRLCFKHITYTDWLIGTYDGGWEWDCFEDRMTFYSLSEAERAKVEKFIEKHLEVKH